MSRDVSGARWPRFMLQIQEIRAKKGTRDRYHPEGGWCPPTEHEQRGSAGINSKLFYCDRNAIRAFMLHQDRLNNEYSPLPAFSIYHNQRDVFALEGDVLNGVGALGPTLEEYDSDDSVEGQGWRHINFMHRPTPDNSSFVGVAGNRNTLNPLGRTSNLARKLIPRIYHADEEAGSNGGLDGHMQLLLGLFRLYEDPRAEDFTTVSGMMNGTWWMAARPPIRPNKRGIVVRVWALPHDDIQVLEDFGEGDPDTVFR